MGPHLSRPSCVTRVVCAAVLLIAAAGIPAFPQTPPEPQELPRTEPSSEPTVQTTPSGEKPAEPGAHGTRLQWKDLPRNILHDEKAIWTSPLHINRSNAKWWLLFGGSAAALIATDRKISEGLPNTHAQVEVSKWTSRLGSDYFIYPLAASFYFGGKLGDNPRARDTARIGIESLADAEIAVNVLKLVTQRPRPDEGNGHGRFWSGGDAFPSGHSIKTWALARVVALEFSETKAVPVIAYGLATTVSVSRFAGRRHFASDALVGAAMGYFIGDYVYKKRHAPSHSHSKRVVSWLATHTNFAVE